MIAATLRWFALLGITLSSLALGQEAPRISEPGFLDRQYMNEQRALVDELARGEFGSGFSGHRERDLELLQGLLDRGLVKPDQTRELQAMGLILGDLLAEDLDLHWVIYEDKVGRSRALRYRETDNYLFPMTMISRRQEAGNTSPVSQIYHKARDEMVAVLPPRPFQ